MTAERLARFLGLSFSRPARPIVEAPRRPLRRLPTGPSTAVEPDLPSLEAELARLDGLDAPCMAA